MFVYLQSQNRSYAFGVACKEGWQGCPEFRDIRDPGCSEG